MAQLKFNAAEVDTTSRDPIPTGTYEAVAVESEMRPTKTEGGVGINIKFEILSEGPAKGRKVWAWINYQHPNKDAQRIGQAELAKLCKAAGLEQLEDTEQLHNIPIMITVGLDRNDKTRNDVKSYAAKAGGQAAPSAGAGAPPWRR